MYKRVAVGVHAELLKGTLHMLPTKKYEEGLKNHPPHSDVHQALAITRKGKRGYYLKSHWSSI